MIVMQLHKTEYCKKQTENHGLGVEIRGWSWSFKVKLYYTYPDWWNAKGVWLATAVGRRKRRWLRRWWPLGSWSVPHPGLVWRQPCTRRTRHRQQLETTNMLTLGRCKQSNIRSASYVKINDPSPTESLLTAITSSNSMFCVLDTSRAFWADGAFKGNSSLTTKKHEHQ